MGSEPGVRNTLSATFIQEYEDYAVAPSVLEDPTFRDELIALGLNPVTGRGTGTVTAVEFDFERNTAEQPLDPRQGYVVSGHVQKAGQWAPRHVRIHRALRRGAWGTCRLDRASSGRIGWARQHWQDRVRR